MRQFLRYFGLILLISAFFRIIPIAVGLYYHESVFMFDISFIISLALGAICISIESRMDSKDSGMSLSQALTLVALSFIVLPLIGSISFLPSMNYNIVDSLFESVSGFTTTGLSMYDNIENLPISLLLWRAETQWLGGLGIIMFFIFIASRLRYHGNPSHEQVESEGALTLYQAQGFTEKLEPNLKQTSSNILKIYLGLTFIGITLLLISGMPFIESIGMTFSSISTGGFAFNDNYHTNNFQLGILCFLMIMGTISFITHNKLLHKKFREYLNSYEKNIWLSFTMIGMMLFYICVPDLKIVIFETISAFTTTGYSITNISMLPHLAIVVIMLGMIIGGTVASTSGGIKVFRIWTLFMLIPWSIKKLISPTHAIIPFKIENKPIEEKEVIFIGAFAFSFILFLIGGTIIFMLLGNSFFNSSFHVISALGTVGLQTMSLSAVHWIGKITLMLCMILGRLEIFPLLILISSFFRKN